MHQLLSYARSTFWITGIIEVLSGLVIMAMGVPRVTSRPLAAVLSVVFGLLIIGLGITSCLAARALRHQKRFARTLVAITSITNLIYFPFGTIAGAVGLYWCFSAKMRALEPLVETFEYQSKPGDGTHKWMPKVMPVLSLVVWVGSMFAVGWWGRQHQLPAKAAINGIVLLLLCEWISTFFHELGHAVAGSAVEMKLGAFIVGPLTAQKRMGRWKLQFKLASLLGGGGGAVASSPLHVRNLRSRMAIEIAAGPAASLMTAIVAMAVLSAMPGSAWETWWKVPAMVAAMSVCGAVINLIPFGFAAGHSDGALLTQLMLGGPFADLRMALKIVGGTMVSPLRPRDVDPVALAHGLRAGIGRREAGTLQMLEVICAVDRDDLTLARVRLESALEVMPTPDKAPDPGSAAEIAFYLAYLDGHAGRAAQWLRDSEALAVTAHFSFADEFDYWLSAAAVRRAEGRDEEADKACRRAKELADRAPNAGLYNYQRDMVEKIRGRDWLRAQTCDEPVSAPAEAI